MTERISTKRDRTVDPQTASQRLNRPFSERNAAEAYPRAACLHHLFEEQVEKTPRKTAADIDGRQLTYEELNATANRIARYLRETGVRRESLVGISLGRSLEMVAALLGILKAGAAYVPLDPWYPRDRLAFMIEDAKIELLLTERELAPALQDHVARTICLDSDWQIVSQHAEDNLNCDTQPSNLAYLIYTSGSTGRPKGVQISHRALVNCLTSMQRWPGLTDEDVLLALTTLSFDIAALEIFLPLITGARLSIATREVASDGARLAAEIARSGATVLQATPTTWRMLVSAGWRGDGRLRMLCGGEPLSADLAKQLLERGGRLWNMYGPTETTIWSTVHEVKGDDRKVLIGRPIANTQVYLLDEQLQPVPAGAEGELHIGGDGLASGYLNRPDLTAEKFVPNPFCRDASARLYKTGDLARFEEDGNIECLGRLDHQTKIRGFRIEVGEIETAIQSHNAVAHAVVVAKKYGTDDQRLLAYLVLNRDAEELTIRELRTFLGQRLPDYMIPSSFLVLEKIPLTPSGKVDRNLLLQHPGAKRVRGEQFIGPLDPLEHQLTEIWEEVLELRPIGIQDNFFELGGNSLLAALMMARVEQVSGKRAALDTLHEGATIEYLANVLMQQEGSVLQSPIVEIQSGDPDRKLPFYFLHGDFNGAGFYCRKLAGFLGEDQPFYALPPIGVDGNRVPSTIEEMAEQHLQELRAHCPQGPYMIGGFCNGALVAFEMARRLQEEGQEIRLLAVIYASAINARFRSLKRLLSIYGRMTGLDDEEQIDNFIRMRSRALSLLETWRRQLARPLHTTLLKASRRLTRVVKRLLSDNQQPQRESPIRIAETASEEMASSRRTVARQKLTDSYNRAMDGYVPQRFNSRVTLFWPTEAPAEEFDDPTMGWRRVTRAVEVRPIAGAHLTCITRHVDVLAGQLRECLQEVHAITEGDQFGGRAMKPTERARTRRSLKGINLNR